MRSRIVLLCLAFLLLITACRLSGITPTPDSSLVNTLVAGTVTAAQGTPLPASTPVEVASPLPPAVGPASTPASTPAATPANVPPGDQPLQAAPLDLPAGVTTILLMGSDQRPNAGDFRTDTMVLLVLKNDGSVSLVSIPRDLWVYLPGKFMQRVNTAMEYGGFSLVQSTFQYNFGFTPRSYVLTNFTGFQSVIDTLGGIDVQVGRTFSDARDGYPRGFTVQPGLVHMDGQTALWYIRARKTTSDLDRLRRSQEVILAMGRKLLSLNGLTHIPQLYTDFHSAFVTDLGLTDVLALLPTLNKIDPGQVQRYAISTDQVTPFITSGGADVLLPDASAIRDLLMQVFQ